MKTITVKNLGYGASVKMEVSFNGKVIAGEMTGNDECWENNMFYQFFVSTDSELFKCFYDVEEGEELDCVDYAHPTSMSKAVISDSYAGDELDEMFDIDEWVDVD